jgi:hypothetical protein
MKKEVLVTLPTPHVGQRQVLRSTARWRVLRAGRRWGKSLVAQDEGIKRLLRGERVAYVAPVFKMCKKFFRLFCRKIPKSLIAETNKSDLEISLITGGYIVFHSGEAIDNIRSDKFHFVIVDEAAFIKDFESAWNESIRPTLTDYKGGALFISTPRGMNFFYALCMKGANKEDGYEEFYFTTYDNPHIDKSEIDSARADLPEDVFNQEYLAVALENAANPFGAKYVNNGKTEEVSTKPVVCYGIDIAKTGGDFTVIIGLDEDRQLAYFDRFQGPWQKTKDAIKALPEGVLKVMDATTYGNVMFENLQMEGVNNIIGHVFTNSTKVQMVYELVLDVQQTTLSYNSIIAAEMLTYEYQYNARTQVLTFNAQSGFHDDTLSALMLANHYSKNFAIVQNWRLYAA